MYIFLSSLQNWLSVLIRNTRQGIGSENDSFNGLNPMQLLLIPLLSRFRPVLSSVFNNVMHRKRTWDSREMFASYTAD